MSKTCNDLKTQFPQLFDSVAGNTNATFSQISPVERANAQSLVFASDSKFLQTALEGPASVIVTSKKLMNPALNLGSKGVLLSENVGVAQATLTAAISGRYPSKNKKIHPTAVISKTAKIGTDVSIGAYAVIGENCVIGDEAYIGSHSVIEDQAEIGSHTVLWAQVYVGPKCRIGNRCVLHPQVVIGSEGYGFAHDRQGKHYRIPQNGIVVLEDSVEIGAQGNVDRAAFEETRIGEGTKIDAHVHIGHNTTVGKNCLFVGGVMIGGSSHLGDHVVVGGGTTIADHVTITDRVSIGGKSGVTNDIQVSGGYGGYPLQPVREYMRTYATIRNLLEMRKNINDLMKAVFGKSE